jgi:hypothetical protein
VVQPRPLEEGPAGRAGQSRQRQRPRDIAAAEEAISQQLFDSGPVAGMQLEHPAHEVPGGGGDAALGEGVVADFDLFVGGLHLVGLEGRPSEQQGEGNDAQTPDIDLIGVSLLACMTPGVPSRTSGAM